MDRRLRATTEMEMEIEIEIEIEIDAHKGCRCAESGDTVRTHFWGIGERASLEEITEEGG